MLFRNLLAMETEEMIRAQPMDAVVLAGGCDKTVPAQMMAAVSANVPALCVVTGSMITGDWQGTRLGACTDCRHYWSAYRGGEISTEEIAGVEQSLCPTTGTCMVMGTASTVACLAEVMGLMLPGGATPPAVTADRLRHGTASGRAAVELATSGRTPADVLSLGSFKNALRVLVALGGSTNAIVHLTAVARRAGVALSLEDLNEASDQVPLLVDCKPAGSGYMEDFHKAGGLPTLLKVLAPLLDLTAKTATGRSLGETLAACPPPGDWQTTIRTLSSPLGPTGSLVGISGTLAPDGAVIKPSATSGKLLQHRGPAVVFESPEDAAQRVNDPSLALTPNHVMVLRGTGPIACGMPEAGSLPIPDYLAKKGIRDMVRVSDGRMSGTAFGTVVLHCTPESAAGGPLALVHDGDEIELDVPRRHINLLVGKQELDRRRAKLVPPPLPERGWRRLYAEHVLPASLGADLDFLAPEH
jgi:dihydroxy-acid dehydratase